MNLKSLTVAAIAASSFTAAYAADLHTGTEVNLVFKQSLSSNKAKAGDHVSLAIKKDVMDDSGHVILKAGTPVQATIEKVDQKDHFGKNARIRLVINPVKGVELQPRDKGKVVGGTRSDEAGAISGGAALLLGPLGLAGGYFVVGHSVHIKIGDTLRTEVSEKS